MNTDDDVICERSLIQNDKIKYLLYAKNKSDKHPDLSCDACSGMYAKKNGGFPKDFNLYCQTLNHCINKQKK